MSKSDKIKVTSGEVNRPPLNARGERMKYWMKENPSPEGYSHILMRHDDPAKHLSGAYDNAHYEFWCEIEALREKISTLETKLKEAANVALGFASFKDGTFELIVRSQETGEDVTLKGPMGDAKFLAKVDRILPTCVFVDGKVCKVPRKKRVRK